MVRISEVHRSITWAVFRDRIWEWNRWWPARIWWPHIEPPTKTRDVQTKAKLVVASSFRATVEPLPLDQSLRLFSILKTLRLLLKSGRNSIRSIVHQRVELARLWAPQVYPIRKTWFLRQTCRAEHCQAFAVDRRSDSSTRWRQSRCDIDQRSTRCEPDRSTWFDSIGVERTKNEKKTMVTQSNATKINQI